MSDTEYHEGYMAAELAEREYLALTMQELLKVAEKAIQGRWLALAQREPEKVREIYKINFPGEGMQ
jgi:hypothetical protein